MKIFYWGVCPRGLGRVRGRAAHRRREQRAGRPVRGRGRPDPERGAPGADRADAGAGRAAAAVKARRTPQESPMVTQVPKSPTPTRPTCGRFLKFLTFGEHICFYRYLVGAGDLDSRVQTPDAEATTRRLLTRPARGGWALRTGQPMNPPVWRP